MKILSNQIAEQHQTSSLNRGHVVFTSFLSYQGQILFLDTHLKRLLMGADFLFPNVGWPLDHKKIKQYVEESFSSNPIDAYFRLTIFDDNLHMQTKPFEIHPDSISVLSALKIKTPGLIPTYVKVSNYVDADIELVRARFKKFDDVLFFDNEKNVTEASTSNILILTKSGVVKTPPLSTMVLDGILRKKLLDKLNHMNYEVLESNITKEDILEAREIWLTNSVKGLRFVDQFEEQFYAKDQSQYLKIVNAFGRYGELL